MYDEMAEGKYFNYFFMLFLDFFLFKVKLRDSNYNEKFNFYLNLSEMFEIARVKGKKILYVVDDDDDADVKVQIL